MSCFYSVELGAIGYRTKTFVVEARSDLEAAECARSFLADKLDEIYFANDIPLDIPVDVLRIVQVSYPPKVSAK